MSGKFKLVARLAQTGEWMTFQTLKSFRGHDVTEVFWAKKPSLEEIDEVMPAFGARMAVMRTLDEVARVA